MLQKKEYKSKQALRLRKQYGEEVIIGFENMAEPLGFYWEYLRKLRDRGFLQVRYIPGLRRIPYIFKDDVPLILKSLELGY